LVPKIKKYVFMGLTHENRQKGKNAPNRKDVRKRENKKQKEEKRKEKAPLLRRPPVAIC